MAEKIRIATINEILNELGISRDKFYRIVYKRVPAIPSTGKEAIYDVEAVKKRIDFWQENEKKSAGRKPLKTN